MLDSALDLELTITGRFFLRSDPVLHLAGLGLPGHRVVLLNLCIQCLALCLPISTGVVVDDRAIHCGACRRGRSSRSTLLLSQYDLLVERQAIRHAHDALDQRLVLVAMGQSPKRATAVGITQVDRARLRGQRQRTNGQHHKPACIFHSLSSP